jgi:hypothetical protein
MSPIASWKPSLAPLRCRNVLLVVGALVVVVAELVVDGDEVVAVHLDAHLDAQIVDLLSMSQAEAWHTTSRSAAW